MEKKKRKPSLKQRFGDDLPEIKRILSLYRMNTSDKMSLLVLAKKYVDKNITMCMSCREQIIYVHRRLKNFYNGN